MRNRSSPVNPPAADCLEPNVLFEVWLTGRSVLALLDEALARSGLDAEEFAVYSVICAGEGVTPTELARWMAAPATTVSSYVKRLQARGHVERVPRPGDGRSYLLRLTDAGAAAHAAASELFGPVLSRVESALGIPAAEAGAALRELGRAVTQVRTAGVPVGGER